jgi:hypothetical protein
MPFRLVLRGVLGVLSVFVAVRMHGQTITLADDFSGSSLDSTVWSYIVSADQGIHTEVTNGELKISGTNSGVDWGDNGPSTRVYQPAGAFDVSISFKAPSVGSGLVYLLIYSESGFEAGLLYAGNYTLQGFHGYYTLQTFNPNVFHGMVGVFGNETATYHTMSLNYDAGVLTAAIDGEFVGSVAAVIPDVTIRPVFSSNVSGQPIDVRFDNFLAHIGTGACITPPSGLVSWWDGDGNANDLMNRNQGTLVNGATFATAFVGQGFGFDGVDDYVSAPGAYIDSLQQLTIETWVKLNSMPARVERFVTLSNEKAVLRYDGQSGPGQLHFYMKIDGVLRHIRVNNVLQTGVFYHVAGTYDGSIMRLYLDGAQVDSLAVAGTVDTGAGVLLSSGGEPLDGLLDEAAIYDRALSSAEVQAIYFAGSFGKCKAFTQVPAPALLSPTNGATGIPPSPTFEWSAVAGATSYRLQISNDSSFSSIVIDQWNLTSTSQAISGLSISRTYYWRVNATDAGPSSAWSSVWRFTTLGGSVFSPTVDNLGITTANGQFGCAWGDYDGDGYLDLYIPGQEQTNVLYKNDDGQHFTDVSTAAGLAGPFGKQATSAIWFDFDNDGDLDLLTCDVGLKLYRNDNGAFTDISSSTKLDTVRAGIALWQAAAGDFDKDGDMDIAFSGGNGQAFPMRILNNNHGVFEDVTNALVPSPTPVLESWNPCWVDVNNDGNLDLWMPTIRAMSQGCKLLINQGGTFVVADTNATGIKARSAVASAWGDFDNDGYMDLFLVPYSGDNDGVAKLYRNNGNGTFTDIAHSLVLDSAFADSRGVCWGDYNNDGRLDLLIGRRLNPQKLYRNDGGTFTEVELETGAGAVGWGDGFRSVVFVDYDNDGFLDLYYNGMGGKLLLHNIGNSNHWVGIRPRGTTNNTAGIGARVWVVAGSLRQVRDIQAGAGGITNGDLWAHFGLGSATSVDSVIIQWPNGEVDISTDVPVDSYYAFLEGSGIQYSARAHLSLTVLLQGYYEPPADTTRVDTITVQLRNKSTPSVGVDTARVLTNKFGKVTFSFPKALASADSFYVVVKHRNHLGVITSIPYRFAPNETTFVNLTDSLSKVQGSEAMWAESNGRFSLRGGNADGNGAVNAIDRNAYWRVQNGTSGTNLPADFNGDGAVNAVDRNAIWRPNNGRASYVP